jgi:outer membrane biosynthesis protein TonB
MPAPAPTPGEAAPSPSPPPLLAEQEELLAALEYSEEGTSQQAALENYADWFEEVTALLGEDWDGENADVITIAAPYPLVACPRQLQGTTVLGVVVGADGTLSEEPAPQILQSSGYGLFNQVALDLMEDYEFEAGNTQRAYQVYVQFEYDPEQCPEAFSQSPDAEQASPDPARGSSSESPSSTEG